MPTPRETILQALLAALQSVPNATILRGATLPERIPTGGLLILRDGDPGTPEVTFTSHAVYLPRPRIEIQGPQGVQASFDWQAAYDATAGQICTITLVNDIATY